MRNERVKREKRKEKKVKMTLTELVLLFSFFIFNFSFVISCDNPFKAGLGPLQDIRPPTVKLISPEVDSFIRGTVTFTGTAEDDFRLAEVYIKVVNFPDLEANLWSDWRPVDVLRPSGDAYNWSVTIDTVGFDPLNPIFPDGDFKIRLKAVDSVGKWGGDEDIVFHLKNGPPVVSLSLPSVTEGGNEGQAGGTKLNYGWAGEFPRPGAFPSNRILDTGSILTGIIRDNQGIVLGPDVDSPEKYPPQFRFWRVNPNPANPNDPGGFLPGVLPPYEGSVPDVDYVPWKDFAYEDVSAAANLMEIGANEYLFMHKIPEDSDRYYGFEVRVLSKDGMKFQYPIDFRSEEWWKRTDVPDTDKNDNKYVLFYARLPQEYPTMDLYQFQDIFGANSWDASATPPKYKDIPNIDLNSYHPYVNSTAVFKKGEFTLRVKATHSRFVDEARIFWERNDKTAKGLFIWDTADKNPPSNPGWNPRNNIEAGRPYEEWGYYDPHQNDTRNFIFIYHNDVGKDTLPVDGIHSASAGKYKIQKYVGSETDWKNDKNPSSWVDYNYTDPQGVKRLELEEGSYDITGETKNGNSLISKYLCTVTIDAQGPEVSLNAINGSLDDGSPDGSEPYTLNGVVEPKFRVEDSRARDSGLRLGPTDYYRRENGRMGDELRYMVIREDQKTEMDNYLKANPWPPLPAVTAGDTRAAFEQRYLNVFEKVFEEPNTALIPGITVYKNGPILDGSFRFKATGIYGADPDVLEDGEYRLYAFARDNAFNVTWESYALLVDKESDKPKIEFINDISEKVTDPSVSADRPDSAAGNGFVVSDGKGGTGTIIRNKFGGNTNLQIRLKDDDSLNLGDERTDAEGNHGITVIITGARYTDTVGSVIGLDSSYDILLTKDEILKIFRGQQLDGNDRRPVRERTGTIDQLLLLERIKGVDLTNPLHPYNLLFGTVAGDTAADILRKKGEYQGSGLPEGIYRISITVRDYRPAKLTLFPWDDKLPAKLPYEAESRKTEIWIAVDSAGPAVDRDSIQPPENSFLAADSGSSQIITGKVSDRNGPVTVKSFTVRSGGSVPKDIGAAAVTLKNPRINGGVWEADFEAAIDLGGDAGSFTYAFVFQDRFGNENQPFQIRYSADLEPPTVGLFTQIRTFEREEENVKLNDPKVTIGQLPVRSTENENKIRLTNGVVSFQISATDNSGNVAGLRWWLLPANRGSASVALDSTGLVTDYNAFPSSSLPPTYVKGQVYYLPEGGAYGEIDTTQTPYLVYIDTEKLHDSLDSNGRGGDGEYRLHVIGIDAPKNVSFNPPSGKWPVRNCILQEIYVLQEQDRPYFSDFAPAVITDVVDSLVITGSISEDHGFDTDSVRIWFSNDNATPSEDSLKEGAPTNITGFLGPYPVKPEHILRPSEKSVNLKINLDQYSEFGLITNGPKSYIIEATDSRLTKFTETGDKADVLYEGKPTNRSRRQHFSFAFDNRDPVIEITSPEKGKTFGLNAGEDFKLIGYIEDAYLAKDDDDNYFIKYRLGASGQLRTLPLIPAYIIDEVPSPNLENGTRVIFEIPASVVTGTMLNFNGLDAGSHTLTLRVEDQSGKEDTDSLNFTKDVLAPVFTFTNIKTERIVNQNLPENIGDWWDRLAANPTANENTWYERKRAWLDNFPVDVIYYDSGVPELTGTFTDDTSYIDIPTFKYVIDNGTGNGTGGARWLGADVRTNGVIDGAGKNVRWTIYLTENGEPNGKPLPDGIHTIRLTVADVCGNVLNPNPANTFMYAFRIVSSVLPKATITTGAQGASNVTGNGYTVFGNANGFTGNTVFTIYGTAENPNLKDIRLKIVDASNRNGPSLLNRLLVAQPDSTTTTVNWDYDTADGTNPPLNPPRNEKINWTYNILKTEYNNIPNGKSYEVIAVAVDQRGTESEEVVWTFTKDETEPGVTFTGSGNTIREDLKPEHLHKNPNVEVIGTQALKIQGRIEDGISKITALEYKIWKWDYDDGSWKLHPLTSQGWTTMPGFTANTSSDINWTIEEELKDFTEGLYRIKVQAKDSSYIRNPATPDRIAATGDFNTGGTGNPVTSEYKYFFYDRSGPAGFDPKVSSFYSSRPGGTIAFKGTDTEPYTVTDPNRIKSVTVRVIEGPDGIPAGMTAVDWAPADANIGPEKQEWTLELKAPFSPMAGAVPDGRYRLEFTATDMAGKAVTVTRTFTLDNRVPEADVTYPAKRPAVTDIPDYASVVVIGGESGEITGSTADRSVNRSESGVKAMWYHLGYINPTDISYPADLPGIRAAYTAYFNANKVWEKVLGTGANRDNDTGANDALFDAKAKYIANGNADADANTWFKYEATNAADGPWPLPTGFIIDNINIYDWRMVLPHHYPLTGGWDTTANSGNSSSLDPANPNSDNPRVRGGFKQYAYTNPIQIKGRDYNSGTNPRMTIPVPESLAGQAGIVSLPLWIRVVDNAGNVSYSCRDIWIYPDGDIPSTSILNPVQATLDQEGKITGRGGSVSADGIAANNTAVYSVIYRIKADDSRTPDAVIPPGNLNTQIITLFNGATEVRPGNDTPEYDNIPTAYQAGGGWYRANLEVARGEPIAPWNFLFNTNDEITEKIDGTWNWGFASSGSGPRDMIRVYMEVFVFSGSTSPEQRSIANGSIAAPLPYVRTFYLKKGAPKITNVMVSTVGNSPDYRDALGNLQTAEGPFGGYYYEPYRSGLEPRRGLFHIRATLDASENQILNQISVRRPNDIDPSYKTLWQNSVNQNIPGVGGDLGTAQKTHIITYSLDSTAKANTANRGMVRDGEWAERGGRYGFEIRIRDNSTPPGEISTILEVGIDNFAPLADPNIRSSTKAAGTAVDFLGRVYDYQGAPNSGDNMPRKVDSVYVWFTKTVSGQTHYVNFNDGTTQLATGNSGSRGGIYLNRNAAITKNGDTVTNITIPPADTGTPGTVPFPGNGTEFGVSGGWVKHISELTAQPGTGMTWIPTGGAWDIQWVFRTDTTKMPDGKITLNYVVFDGAGNASFYQQDDIYIRNKYPQINKVTLETNNSGVGAVFTTHPDPNASTEFELRDNNYNLNYDNSEGYLNSGFISKNQTIGFRVEMGNLPGNEPFSYRLQYVTREKVPLDTLNLGKMVDDRNDPNKINLYTIAEHGDYSTNNWATLGVNISTPPLGTHFVFTPESLTTDLRRSDSAKVWRYTPVLTRTSTRPMDNIGGINTILPNESNAATDPGHNFNFSGTVHFDPAVNKDTVKPQKIGEFNGSHPDNETLNKPEDTAFFLIRVWDSVKPVPSVDARDENEQLYDAVVIGMNIYLTDRDRPTSRLYDLNPYTEATVIGNNNGTDSQQKTRENAMDPRGIGENILRGGLYNTGTAREMVKSGHIEPRNGTTAIMPLVMTAGTTTYAEFLADGFVEGDGGDGSDTQTKYNINRYKAVPFTDPPTYIDVPRDQVSGKVILRGVAWDNQLIKEIRVNIGTETRTILTRGTGTLQAVNNSGAQAVEEIHWKTGHTIEWAYIWDTETWPAASGTPAANQTVTVTVIDQLGNNNAGLPSTNYTVGKEDNTDNTGITAYSATTAYQIGDIVRYDGVNYYCIVQSVPVPESSASRRLPPSENTTSWTRLFHNQVTVDIVPYISGFERDSRFATTRSRQGWYSFYQGETGIKAVGFNLVGSTGNTTMNLTNGTTNYPLTVSNPTKNSVTFSVPAAATSGKITLNTGITINGSTEALNHRTGHDTQSWNREYHTFTDGSDLWLNKSFAHIWRSTTNNNSAPVTYFGDTTAANGSRALQRPAMALEYTGNNAGRLTGAWTSYVTAGIYWGYNDGAVRKSVYHSMGDPLGGTDISFYNGSQTNSIIGLNTEFDGTATLKIRLFNSGTGTTPTPNYGNINTPGGNDDEVHWSEGRNGQSPTDRWKHNRVSRSAGQSHIVSYDSYNRRLYYSRGSANGTNGTNATAWMTIDGNGVTTGAGQAVSTNAGMYSAIDYVTNGGTNGTTIVPVVAYYDTANDTIRLAYASQEAPVAANWTRRYVLVNTDPLFRGSGTYVSIKVDKSNGIHLAFYNSVYQTVVYAYASSITGDFTAYTIDNVVKGGAWTDISVNDNGDPTIVYADSARTGNYDGIRMAYRSRAGTGTIAFTRSLDCPVTGKSITGWEALTVPADYQINDDRLNVEVWPPNNRAGGTVNATNPAGWSAAVGYASRNIPGKDEGMFRIAYFYQPVWKDYTE